MARPNKSALKKPLWQDPPQARKGNRTQKPESPWVILRRELMRHPNKWGVIAIHTNIKSASANKKQLATRGIFPKGEFEMVSRTVAGKGRIYARYVTSQKADTNS